MGHKGEGEIPGRSGLQRYFSRLERSGNVPKAANISFPTDMKEAFLLFTLQAGRAFWQYPAAALRQGDSIFYCFVFRHLERAINAALTTLPTAPRSFWRRRSHAAQNERTSTSSDSASAPTWPDSWALFSAANWAG